MTATIKSKRCSKCKEIKSTDEFSNNRRKKDGLCCWCKQCKNQYYQNHRTERLKHARKHRMANPNYDKEWYREHREERRQYDKRRRSTVRGHLYLVWNNIIKRCTNPQNRRYPDWGGRGIQVCAEWRDCFEKFHDYVVNILKIDPRGLTIDRINNDGNYEPGNIRFVSYSENNRNRRECKKCGKVQDIKVD